MRSRLLLAAIVLLAPAMAQQAREVRAPDVEAQRTAMKKLGFLVGKWSGAARILRASGPVELVQTEVAEYRLDGLILTIEGVGKKADGAPGLQALGLISYDDVTGEYRMRAFNDGRWLETEVKLAGSRPEMTWGFALGDARTSSTLRINEKGEWTELTELTLGSQPPRKFLELTVKREK